MFLKKYITSDQIAFWVRKHFKKILFVLCVSVFVCLAFIAWMEWQKKEEEKIHNSLYNYQKSLHRLVEKKDKKIEEKQTLPGLSEREKKTLPFSKEMEKKAALYEKVIRKNKKSKIAIAFAIDLADFYYRYDKLDSSINLLSLFALPEKPSSLYHLASFQLAAYYMSSHPKRECEKALSLLSALSSNEKASSFHLESNLQQGLCLEHLNRYEQALHKYDSVLNDDPDTYVGRLARDYKRMLILNKNLQEKNE